MAERKHLIEIENEKGPVDGKQSRGLVYRSVFVKDGFLPPVSGMETCWDVFRISVEKYPRIKMLGHREIVNG